MVRSYVVVLLLLLSTHVSGNALYRHWFPAFEDYYTSKIDGSCRQDYEAYISNASCPSCAIDWPVTGSARGAILVANCLLNDTEEYIKVNLAVGSVILGLLPTVLSFSGSTTTEIGLLALRRPVMATLLAFCAPSIYPTRALDYDETAAPVQRSRVPFKPLSHFRLGLFSFSEYIIALGAAANVATMTWKLCVNSPSAMGPDFLFFPLLWPLVTFIIHVLGTLYVSIRVQVAARPASWKERVMRELSPCASHVLHITTVRPQSLVSAVLAWFTSLSTIVHIIYGTAALSSLLFVAAEDAVIVGVRLLASAVVARGIVMYELSGIAVSANIKIEE